MSTGGSAGGVAASVTLDDAQIQAGVARLQAAMDSAGAAMKKLQADFAAGTISVDKFTEEIADLQNQMSRAQAGASSFGASVASSGQRSQAAARGITDFSRAAEDFSTGGFLGVMNNIPGVLTNVGTALGVGTTGLALFTAGVSIAVATGYLLYKNWDSVTGLFQDKNPFPKTTDSIDGMTEAIKKNEKELDTLREKQKGTADELARYNKLVAENIQLEKQKKEAQERKKAVESVVESVDPEQEAKAQAFKTAAVGRGEEVRDGIVAHFERKKVDRNAAIIAEMNAKSAEQMAAGDVQGAARTRRDAMGFVAANNAVDSGKMADELIGDIMQGRAGALEKFKGIANAPGNQDMFPPDLRNKFRSEDPETKKQGEKTSARAELDRLNAKRVETWEEEQGDIEDAKWQRGIDQRSEDVKKRNERRKRSKQIEQEAAKREKESVDTAKEAMPGIEQITEQAFLEARAGGMNTEKAREEVQRRLKRELMSQGMDDDMATRASRAMSVGAAQRVQEQVVRTRLGLRNKPGEDQQQEVKASQVFAGSELMNRIQSGTTNEQTQHNRKMETMTEQMYNALAQQILPAINRVKGVNARVTR